MPKREWSMITKQEMLTYLKDGEKLVVLAEQHKIPVFAAALAGVELIRNALAVQGGSAEWWFKLITSTKENPLDEFTIV